MSILKYILNPKFLIRKLRNFFLNFSLGRIETYIKDIYDLLDKPLFKNMEFISIDFKTNISKVAFLKEQILKFSPIQFTPVNEKEWDKLQLKFNNLFPSLLTNIPVDKEKKIWFLIKETKKLLSSTHPNISRIGNNIVEIKKIFPQIKSEALNKIFPELKKLDKDYADLIIRLRKEENEFTEKELDRLEAEKAQRKQNELNKNREELADSSEKEGEKDTEGQMTNYIKRFLEKKPANIDEIISISQTSGFHQVYIKDQIEDINFIPNLYSQLEEYIFQKGENQKIQLEYFFAEQSVARAGVIYRGDEEGIEIIDWGCGQAFATTCFFSFFEEQLKEHNTSKYKIRQIYLIDKSSLAIKRGLFHLNCLITEHFISQYPKVNILEKDFLELHESDFKLSSNFKLHFLSNSLIDSLDITQMSELIKATCKGRNMFICTNDNIDIYVKKKINNLISKLNANKFAWSEGHCDKLNSRNEKVPLLGSVFMVVIS
jgi:hypothetical protein